MCKGMLLSSSSLVLHPRDRIAKQMDPQDPRTCRFTRTCTLHTRVQLRTHMLTGHMCTEIKTTDQINELHRKIITKKTEKKGKM